MRKTILLPQYIFARFGIFLAKRKRIILDDDLLLHARCTQHAYPLAFEVLDESILIASRLEVHKGFIDPTDLDAFKTVLSLHNILDAFKNVLYF